MNTSISVLVPKHIPEWFKHTPADGCPYKVDEVIPVGNLKEQQDEYNAWLDKDHITRYIQWHKFYINTFVTEYLK